MNLRIKELAVQADWDDEFREDFDIEKFAELIVRECAKVCLDPNHWYEDAAGETYNQVILKHFGVEE